MSSTSAKVSQAVSEVIHPPAQTNGIRTINLKLVWAILITCSGALITSTRGLFQLEVTSALAKKNAEELREPRFTLSDYEVRATALEERSRVRDAQIQKSLDKRERWMEVVNAYILKDTESSATTRANIAQINASVSELKKMVESLETTK